MVKKRVQYYKSRPLDLHGLTHSAASLKVENYVLTNQDKLPMKIITGDSDKMKKIVIDFTKKFKFKIQLGEGNNKGFISIY